MKENKGRNSKQYEEEPQRPRMERVVVAVPHYHKNQESTTDFEWPDYPNEKARIKANTKRFANKSIPEIFGVTVSREDLSSYDTLRELRAGDMIDVVVTSITDDTVTFETVATKQIIQSSINLKKYQKLRLSVPFNAQAVVTRANREIAYIDIIRPLYERWLNNILLDPDQQRETDPNVGPKPIYVRNLQLTRGGLIGQAEIPVISEFVGQEYTVEAFIPGSQIVLNIEDDFEKWNGKTTTTFVTNYMKKPGTKDEMSLVCSRKEFLKFLGDKAIIQFFNSYCEDSQLWKDVSVKMFDGVVTGIINSSKKCGVFVEIPELYITGMVAMPADQLVNYKPKDKVTVKIVGFEENTYFDQATGQVRHDLPYEFDGTILRDCNIKPILKFA